MSFNGSGTFLINSTGQPVVAGTTITDTAFNALTADLATGLTNTITRDGQSPATANIPLGSNKITGLASGTATTDAANLGQVQNALPQWAGTAGGTKNALTLTVAPAITAYAAGQLFRFKSGSTASDSTVTVDISSLGTKAIQLQGAALVNGEIQANKWYEILYDGTAFQLQKSSAFNDNIRMANGTGIDFSATANSSGTMTSELLNDYEEGTWTPSLGGTSTLSPNVGYYTKIGREVSVHFNFTVTAIGTGSTYQITGLPFTANGSIALQTGSMAWNSASTNYTTAVLYVQSGGTTLELVGITAAAPNSSFGNTSMITTGTSVRGTIVYSV